MRLDFATLSRPMQKTGGHGGTLGTASNHGALSRPHLPENGGDTRGHVPAAVIEEQPEGLGLSPMSPERPQPWGHGKPCIHAVVPAVPNVPAKNHRNEIDREAFEERAAIREFGGGLPREEAEAIAWHEDDRRRCAHCLNIRPGGICKVAEPGGLVSAMKGYRPNQAVLQRCAGYRPCPDDPDRRPGWERWPGLIQKGVNDGNN